MLLQIYMFTIYNTNEIGIEKNSVDFENLQD